MHVKISARCAGSSRVQLFNMPQEVVAKVTVERIGLGDSTSQSAMETTKNLKW